MTNISWAPFRARPTPSSALVTCYLFYLVGNAAERYIVQGLLTSESLDGRDLSVKAARHFL